MAVRSVLKRCSRGHEVVTDKLFCPVKKKSGDEWVCLGSGCCGQVLREVV